MTVVFAFFRKTVFAFKVAVVCYMETKSLNNRFSCVYKVNNIFVYVRGIEHFVFSKLVKLVHSLVKLVSRIFSCELIQNFISRTVLVCIDNVVHCIVSHMNRTAENVNNNIYTVHTELMYHLKFLQYYYKKSKPYNFCF